MALFILFVPKTASAQAPAADEAAASATQPTMGTVELQPGANEVGWIAEAVGPQVLFDEIPELEAIYAWHALDRRWQMAARDVPSSLWTLYRLRPGMGFHLQIAGDAPVRWERSLVPARGKVELGPGDNFVAWAGRDGWDVNQIAKGIGRLLQEIHRYNPGTGELDAIWPVGEGAEAATVARGEALWVRMPRGIVWLQPTDVMPRLVFPGGASESVQTAARRDLRSTLDYFAAEYGIQADFAEFSIYLPAEGESLKRQLILDGHDVDDADVERILDSAGVYGYYGVVIRRSEDIGDLEDISYQRTMTHEYFHRIQDNLENDGDDRTAWIIEGSADYSEWDQQVAAGERTWPEITSEHETICGDVPRLVSAEDDNDRWHYYLGRLALRRLVEQSEPDAWIDFYRELGPAAAGLANRWRSSLPWRDVFALTFDVALDEFYTAFDQWQGDLVARNCRPSDRTVEEHVIEGRVVRSDGTPVAGGFVSANEIALGPDGERRSVGDQHRAETDADGNFSVIAPSDGRYRLRIDLDDDQRCGIYYSRGGGALARDDADLLAVSGRTLRNVSFTVAADACLHELRGTVRGPGGEPLAGIVVQVVHIETDALAYVRTNIAGDFALKVPRNGSYRIRIDLTDDCRFYFSGGSVTHDRDAMMPVQVRGEDVRVDFRVPGSACRSAISGRLLDASGEPMADVRMTAVPTDVGDSLWSSTDGDGAFSFTVPQDGGYRVLITLVESCRVYHADGGVTVDRSMASLVRVSGEDIRVGDVQVPEDVCSNSISGRLLNASGGPMAGMQLAVIAEDPWSWHGARTGDDGAFNVTVPQDGGYRIRITLAEGCEVYFAGGGVTADRDMAATVRVAGRDVRGDITVPDGWCEHAISGRLLDASGEPMAYATVRAIPSGDGFDAWSRTGADGAFMLTVPQDGGYRISITLADGCIVYFASDGVTANPDMAATVRVAGRNVRGNITIPGGWCEHAISGRLLDGSGEPIAGASLAVITEDLPNWNWARTDGDGAFRLIVPQDGSYQIYFRLMEHSMGGCGVFAARNGVTRNQHAALPVRIAGGDVRVGDIRIPAGACNG